MEQLVNVLQQVLMGLLVALVPVLTKFIIEVLVAYKNKLVAELENAKPELFWYLEQAAILGVAAAEQSGLAKLVKDKKAYAIEVAQQWLDAHGWSEIDIVILDAAIEAEVIRQFPK